MTVMRLVKRLASVAVVGASIVFLTLALRASWGEVGKIISDTNVLLFATGLSVVYGLLFFILFGSWFYTLRQNSPARVSLRAGAYVYGVSNIAKYLPGNVFHFAGRQILGARAGWSHGAIARATVLEIVAIVTGVCLLVLVLASSSTDDTLAATALGGTGLFGIYWRSIAVALLICGVVVFFVAWYLRVFERVFGVSAKAFLVVLALDTTFFGLYAILAVLFTNQLAAEAVMPSVTVIAIAYLVSWLAGFVVPGAPGGLGVRESVLVLLLAGASSEGTAIALALGLGMRFVNTLGDAVCAGIAYVLGRSEMSSHAAASTAKA